MQSDVSGERAPWPFVAVVIPVFNDAVRLATCLRALEHQTYPADRYQVLVVDNGSTEDIAAVCRTFDQVRYLHEPRPGSYAARNTALGFTDAEILAFTDSDCIPHRDWLERGVAHLTTDPGWGMVGGSVVVFPKDASRRSAVELYESAFAFPQKQRIVEDHWAVTANLFVYRRVIEAVGPFDAEMLSGGDAEWGRRAHAAGYRIAFAEGATVDHPARGSLGALLTKARRVAGGARAARHGASKRSVARYVARSLYRGARKTVRILSGDRFGASERFTLPERLKIAAVHNLFTLARLTEVVGLRFTRRSPSRS